MVDPFIHYVILVKISHYIDPTMWESFLMRIIPIIPYETESHLSMVVGPSISLLITVKDKMNENHNQMWVLSF